MRRKGCVVGMCAAAALWLSRCSFPMCVLLLQSLVLMALCFPSASMCPKGCSCMRTTPAALGALGLLSPGGAAVGGGLPSEPLAHPHAPHGSQVPLLNVTCSQSRLKEIPRDLPPETVLLRLDRNHISAIPERAFQGLRHLRELNLSNNALETLGEGTFTGLEASLLLLDLSHNRISSVDKNAFTRLKARILVHDNPWHCDCALQQALGGIAAHNHEAAAAAAAATRVLCRSSEGARGGGYGGIGDLHHHDHDHDGQPYMAVDADLCNLVKRTTDYAMLVTMFGWFAMVISYVVYYVRQNQEDARRHLEYLKSLPSKPKRPDEPDDISTVV